MGDKNYDLKAGAVAEFPAPELLYRPPAPAGRALGIGFVGCGGISEHHLQAYLDGGWEVLAFLDRKRAAAEGRRDRFYPRAQVCDSLDELLSVEGVEIVDIATHPEGRASMVEAAIKAGRHVLSQKPFATDLETGRRLVQLADRAGVKLAVNQNGRWAPYFSYMRQAVREGLIGEVGSVHMTLNWDHTWTAGTPFEEVHHLMLYDFGIHWFDAARSFFGRPGSAEVHAMLREMPGQPIKPPLMAAATIGFDRGLATLAFNGGSRFDPCESLVVVGNEGTLRATGDVCGIGEVELTNARGQARARVEGSWFPDGFRGAMGELMCAIEENREPENSAADNLGSLALVLAAMESANSRQVVSLKEG